MHVPPTPHGNHVDAGGDGDGGGEPAEAMTTMKMDVYVWGYVDKIGVNTTVDQTSLKLEVSNLWATHHMVSSSNEDAFESGPQQQRSNSAQSRPDGSVLPPAANVHQSTALSLARVELKGTRTAPRGRGDGGPHGGAGADAGGAQRQSSSGGGGGAAKERVKIFMYRLQSVDVFSTLQDRALSVIVNSELMTFRLHDSLIAAEDVFEQWLAAIATIPPSEAAPPVAINPAAQRPRGIGPDGKPWPVLSLTAMINLGNIEISATVRRMRMCSDNTRISTRAFAALSHLNPCIRSAFASQPVHSQRFLLKKHPHLHRRSLVHSCRTHA
jgi:hypothetical protein